jgi:long-chain acyl-CoA synthetase
MSKGFLLHEKFTEICGSFPQAIAFIQIQINKTQDTTLLDRRNSETFTYSQIHNLAKRLGIWLLASGINKQDKIAILLDNCPEWSIVYFGILFSGAIAVPLDIRLSDFEICNLLTDSEAKIIFTVDKFISFFDKNFSNLVNVKKIVLIDKKSCQSPYVSFDDIIGKEQNFNINFPQMDCEDIASIIYTSGTVGKPKGVMLSHKNFSSNFQGLEKLKICNHKDTFISILPLHHAFAFTATLIFPLFLGAKIVYPSSLKSGDILDCMRRNSVTIFVGVPEVFIMIHKAIFKEIRQRFYIKRLLYLSLSCLWLIRRLTGINLSKLLLHSLHQRFGQNLRFLVSGGARLDINVAKDFFKLGFTILEGYGLTETAPVVSLNLPSRWKIGSVGRPIEGVSVKIGENNEILIRGDNVMKGYFNAPLQTQQMLRDNWLHSGDAGYIDEDGYIFITARLKEILVLSSGKNIYPEEIENYFKKSDFIREICLLTVRKTDGTEVLVAVVVPDFEFFKQVGDANINRKIKWELENFSSRLPTYKRITDFIIVREELPKTRLGKIKRYEVEAKYLNRFINKQGLIKEEYIPSLEEINILSSETGKKVIDFLYDKISFKKQIRLEDNLELDLGFDSLARVELAMGLENIFKVELPESLMGEIFTVRELILKLNKLLISKKTAVKIPKQTVSWKDLLNMPPPDKIKEKIDFSPNILNRFFSFIITKFLFSIFKLFCLLKIKGRENLPTQGAYILCPNHASYFDGFIVAASVPFKILLNLYFLGDKNIFEHPSIRWALKIAHLVPIDPTKELMNTLQVSSFILRHNKMLCVFPEGLRCFDGKPGEFKKGVGILSKELNLDSGIRIIPVAIIGSFQAWPRTQLLPRPYPIRIIFGKPVGIEKLRLEGKESGITDDYQAIAFAIKKQVENLFYNN